MKKVIICFLLFTFSHLTFAYNQRDLERLQTTCSCPGCDLTNINLPNFILGDKKTLNVTKAKVDKNGFVVCDISNANFSGANLRNAYFSPADFGPGIHDKVGKVVMQKCNFNGANLTGSHLNAVMADRSNFKGANLTNVTIMKSASFSYCNFSSAMMYQISVTPPMGGCGANFSYSDFTAANLTDSKLIADFTQANFTRANLTNSHLMPCDAYPQSGFLKTNFFEANLMKATYDNQDITDAMLINARLCKTLLSSGVSNRDCEAGNEN